MEGENGMEEETKEDVCPSCNGTGFTGFARTFDETCSCCLGTGEIKER
jgi:DnaJ-class molecular chaperone